MYYEGKSVGCHNINMQILRGKQYIGRENKEGSSKETRQKDLSRRGERTHGEGGGSKRALLPTTNKRPIVSLLAVGSGSATAKKRKEDGGGKRVERSVCAPVFLPK